MLPIATILDLILDHVDIFDSSHLHLGMVKLCRGGLVRVSSLLILLGRTDTPTSPMIESANIFIKCGGCRVVIWETLLI